MACPGKLVPDARERQQMGYLVGSCRFGHGFGHHRANDLSSPTQQDYLSEVSMNIRGLVRQILISLTLCLGRKLLSTNWWVSSINDACMTGFLVLIMICS
jgi:hypothetical protein